MQGEDPDIMLLRCIEVLVEDLDSKEEEIIRLMEARSTPSIQFNEDLVL
jgi:hypothetical protein